VVAGSGKACSKRDSFVHYEDSPNLCPIYFPLQTGNLIDEWTSLWRVLFLLGPVASDRPEAHYLVAIGLIGVQHQLIEMRLSLTSIRLNLQPISVAGNLFSLLPSGPSGPSGASEPNVRNGQWASSVSSIGRKDCL